MEFFKNTGMIRVWNCNNIKIKLCNFVVPGFLSYVSVSDMTQSCAFTYNALSSHTSQVFKCALCMFVYAAIVILI